MIIGNRFARDNAVSFGAKFAASEAFDLLFRDGMALVEETAAYLDGDGRADACHLPRVAALAYASESMRLTTRLMQIASWLLLQRAVNEGEMSQREADCDKGRSRVAWTVSADQDKIAVLPPSLSALIAKSLELQSRVQRLDALLCEPVPSAVIARPVENQLARLRTAFPG